MQKLLVWLTILSLTVGAIAFPSFAGATGQYDDDSDSTEIDGLFPDEEEDEIVEPASDRQYKESTVPELSEPEDTAEETTTGESTIGEETPLESTVPEKTVTEESTDVDDDPMETTVPEEDDPGSNPTEEETSSGPGPGTESGGDVPPVSSTPPLEVGQTLDITVIDHDLTLNIVDIYDGGVIYTLPNGERYEVLLYDLDYDGWISHYEMYICTVGWFGYRYYDYTPDDMYHFIGDTYNINISNNYQQTGAIRPTPTERVAGMLPDTGGPALIGGAVALAVVGAALVGRYSRRS